VDPSLYVIRIAGNSNEDLYRIFHYATGFYGERIVTTASRSAPVPSIVTKNNSNHIRDKNIYHRDKRQQTQPSSLSTNQSRNNTFGDSVVTFDSHKNSEAFSVPWFPSKSWRLFMLSDSALPVGSFAHSSGMEAAHQWGMIAGSSSQDDDVKRYVWAATQHAIGMWMPVILHHRYGRMIQTIDEMLEFDEYVHSFLCSNEIACATSLEQGRNLLRVYLECFVDPVRWTNHPPKEANGNDGSFVLSLLRNVHRHGRYKHWCTVWSFIFQNEMKSSSFDYDAFSLAATTFVGYNVARDIVAAAVRLNLVGAMAGQRILKEIGDELQRQQQQQQQQQQHPLLSFASAGHEAENPCSPVPFLPLPLVGCAPVIDILQSSHSILSSRLFRS
jgi:urease accessory protein UreF